MVTDEHLKVLNLITGLDFNQDELVWVLNEDSFDGDLSFLVHVLGHLHGLRLSFVLNDWVQDGLEQLLLVIILHK